jgi:hypothetical protein
MNKRDLRKALDAHAGGDDVSSGRRLAYMVVTDIANSGRVPRALREPLHRVAMLCLACDAADFAPPGSKPYSELYTEREDAYVAFGDAALAHYRKRRREEPPPVADVGVS